MHFPAGNDLYSYEDIVENQYVNIDATKKMVIEQNGLFAETYKWDRIESVNQFLEEETRDNVYKCGIFNVNIGSKLTTTGTAEIEGKTWILRFLETDYTRTKHNTYTTYAGTMVGDVAVLRLKFQIDGETFNLGVVGNMQTGDGIPDNVTTTNINAPWWFWVIVICLILVILGSLFPIVFTLLVNILEWLIKGIWFVLKWLFKGIWYVISAPFSVVKKE